MKRTVRIHAAFRTDLRAHLRWLVDLDEESWIEGLEKGLAEASALLAEQPGRGALEASEGTAELRRMILRRVPYVIWYSFDSTSRKSEVWLLRLFHARQQRPRPTWPPGRRRTRR